MNNSGFKSDGFKLTVNAGGEQLYEKLVDFFGVREDIERIKREKERCIKDKKLIKK